MENTELRYVACVGSRTHASDPVAMDIMFAIGAYLALQGWVVKTGAAQGADQAFADGALSVGGKVLLYLPWGEYRDKETGEVTGYNKGWVDSAVRRGAVVVTFSKFKHLAAAGSVDRYHPHADKLKGGARSLHARNHMILLDNRESSRFDRTVTRVVSWPGAKSGGTDQAMRIALGYWKKDENGNNVEFVPGMNPAPVVYDLSNANTLRAVWDRVFPHEVRELVKFASEYPVD